MMGSLNSAVAGIRNFQSKLDVIGNNVANSNTIAYKGARSTFADTFSQTLQGGSDAGGVLQVGSGVTTSAIKTDFSRGVFQNTGRESDLYIDGAQGFFIVKNAAGESFATRAGDFVVDNEGYLVTNDGYHVQGYNNQVVEGGTFSTIGNIRIFDDKANRPVTPGEDILPTGYKILSDGRIRMHLNNDRSYDTGQVLMQNFTDLNMLTKEGGNLYGNLDAAGPLNGNVASMEAPTKYGMGSLISGALEMSNVDLASEFADLITTQRGFQANARIITTSDEMLQEVVNLKR